MGHNHTITCTIHLHHFSFFMPGVFSNEMKYNRQYLREIPTYVSKRKLTRMQKKVFFFFYVKATQVIFYFCLHERLESDIKWGLAVILFLWLLILCLSKSNRELKVISQKSHLNCFKQVLTWLIRSLLVWKIISQISQLWLLTSWTSLMWFLRLTKLSSQRLQYCLSYLRVSVFG